MCLPASSFGEGVVIGGVTDAGSMTLHIQSLNAMCMPSFIPVSFPVFGVCELKLNNNNRFKLVLTLVWCDTSFYITLHYNKKKMKNLQIELFQFF